MNTWRRQTTSERSSCACRSRDGLQHHADGILLQAMHVKLDMGRQAAAHSA